MERADTLRELLHPLERFVSADVCAAESLERVCEISPPTYLYEGDDPNDVSEGSGAKKRLWLPRTVFVEQIARGLMRQLQEGEMAPSEGKMFGVLLVRDAAGKLGVLKAFSGLWQGDDRRKGWVPPIPGREEVAQEEQATIAALNEMKARLIELADLPVRAELAQQQAAYVAEVAEKRAVLKQQKQIRDQQRALWGEGAEASWVEEQMRLLEQQSRSQKQALRAWMQSQEEALSPLRQAVFEADAEMQRLKQARKHRSRTLQDRMYGAYRIANFSGRARPLEAFFSEGRLPTGTGDCCAPKLLHLAATHRLRPLGLAEFWWGPSLPNGSRVSGEFYGACAERCQPIMGFLLSGLTPPQNNQEEHSPQVQIPSPHLNSTVSLETHTPQARTISQHHGSAALLETYTPQMQTLAQRLGCSVLYEDAHLLVVDKPAGLLSVPGRTQAQQESVLGRLWLQAKHGAYYAAVHRLDALTSGILVFTREIAVHSALQRQFQQRSVEKRYEALLSHPLEQEEGVIELPLWGDPAQRPLQRVDWLRGKPARTRYRLLCLEAEGCRVAFFPETGRTHQIRVHSADPAGLHAPICGDPLYGGPPAQRLFLHACAISFVHPVTHVVLSLSSPAPF
ncbi:pseudouridine synthase [Myxococcota bacterium]|nr:pseudouridine synthase [Myxococcota bacterium]